MPGHERLSSRETDVAVVGSGFAGLLVARELLRAGRDVTLVERGGLKPHASQLASGTQELDEPTTSHNHEADPVTPHEWQYCYGVGGSSLRWAGVAPRLLPSDFQLQTRYAVGRDWPIGYSELEPYYREAERVLGVAAGANPLFSEGKLGSLPPHPLSPLDRMLEPLLDPLVPLPQARATRSLSGRSECCAAATCELCPVDARFSILHLLTDEGLLGHPRLELVDCTAVARLRTEGDGVDRLETIDARGNRATIHSSTVVLAAGGLENPGILLRSGLGGEDVGRWLYDHGHRVLHVRLDRPVPNLRGSALVTGVSYAYAEGDWRSERGAQLVLPYNPGLNVAEEVERKISAGRRGRELAREVRDAFRHTLVLDTIGEDLPVRERSVELSPNKDGLGLPKNRIRYPADEGYLERGRQHMYADLEARLKTLGGRLEHVEVAALGGHSLGACHMGHNSGVVDADQRSHRFENLFVTGGSAFPSYGSAHPTLTISALAIRLGRMLAGAPVPGATPVPGADNTREPY